jgi:hypothetical protein
MKLNHLLKLQVLYAVLGLGYNGVSFFLSSIGQKPLASTSPVLGAISMVVYGLFLIPGFRGAITLYRILMAVAIVVIGYGGVVQHFINIFTQPQVYSSMLAWAAAVLINIFGLVLNIIAACGKFKK